MKRIFLVAVLCLLGCITAFCDTLFSYGSIAQTTAFNPSGAYWNNTSSDIVDGSNLSNVGDFLGDAGAFALNGNVTPNCSTCGSNYMANGGQMVVDNSHTPNYPSGLQFQGQQGGLQIQLLYSNSGANGFSEVGIYDAADPNVNHLILQQGLQKNLNNSIGTIYTSGIGTGSLSGAISLAGGSPYAAWGIYVRTCVEGSISYQQCNADGAIVTYYMGAPSQESSVYAPYDATHQHFAVFQSGTNSNQYFAALEDWAFNANSPDAAHNGVEGYGDYNDMILSISTSGPSAFAGPASFLSIDPVPEPSTLVITGIGFLGLGICKWRRR